MYYLNQWLFCFLYKIKPFTASDTLTLQTWQMIVGMYCNVRFRPQSLSSCMFFKKWDILSKATGMWNFSLHWSEHVPFSLSYSHSLRNTITAIEQPLLTKISFPWLESVHVDVNVYIYIPDPALYNTAIWICQCQQQSVALVSYLPNLIHGQMERIH